MKSSHTLRNWPTQTQRALHLHNLSNTMSHPDHDENPATRKTSPADGANDLTEVAREWAKQDDAPKMDKYARFQLLVIASLLGVMIFFAGREMLYSLLGKTIDAKVTRQSNEHRSAGRHGGVNKVTVVEYSFSEASGRQRQERDEIRAGSGPTITETVPVEYVSGIAGFSRVRGNRGIATFVLVACGIVFLIMSGLFCVSFRPRLGAFVFWLGVFFVSAIVALFITISFFRNDSLPRDDRILLRFVGLVFAAIGYGGMWMSGLGLWKSTRPKSAQAELDAAAVAAPQFSADSLVCRSSGTLWKPVAVIVDRTAGMIHFQNCHRPYGFWVIRSQAWWSGPLTDVLSIRRKTVKSGGEMTEYSVIETRTGTANVTQGHISNYEALCLSLEKPRTRRDGE